MKKSQCRTNFYVREEDALQAAFCKLLDALMIRYYAIPNGAGSLGHFARRIMKATGRRAGVPDLHIPSPVFNPTTKELLFHSVYIEVKTPTGRVTPAQKEWHAYLQSQGYAVLLLRSVRELIDAIKELYPEKAKRLL